MESKIQRVEETETHYFISTDGCGFGYEKKHGGAIPKVGDLIVAQTSRTNTIRGVILNGVQIFYKTDEQLEDEHKAWVEEYKRKQKEDFEKNRAQLDKDFDSLPQPFQDRITRFRENNPEFRVEGEGYEMFCCTEAVKMAETLKTSEEVEKFSKLDYNEQKKLVNFDDGHSGNTFGCAVKLAYWYLKEHGLVSQMHAALSPLVGSEQSGDLDVQEVRIGKKEW